ncbi:MAG: thioesterase [Phycisphaerae bacterium]|nr:thioesterase [Phycisphaerae bacterium]
MKPGLVVGLERETQFIVTEDMCPAFDGVVVHRVCATWTVVQYMEIAGRLVLAGFLEAHEEGVGTHVSCDHHAPAPVGSMVRVVAKASSVSVRELVCETRAFVGDRLIATGRTDQKTMPRTVLQRLLGEQ